MKTPVAILEYISTDHHGDPESAAALVGALHAEGAEARLLPFSREVATQIEASLIWLRCDIRSRQDLLSVLERARILESRGMCVFPAIKSIWMTADRWETHLALRKAGLPVPPTVRGREFASCPFPAIFKARTGRNGLESLIIANPGDLAAHDIPTPASLPDGTQVEGVMLRSPLKSEKYLCQAYLPHTRTLVAALAGQTMINGLEYGKDASREGSRAIVPLSDDAWALASKALRSVGLTTGTVTLIEAVDGFRVLDLDASPRLIHQHLPNLDLAGPMARSVLALLPKT